MKFKLLAERVQPQLPPFLSLPVTNKKLRYVTKKVGRWIFRGILQFFFMGKAYASRAGNLGEIPGKLLIWDLYHTVSEISLTYPLAWANELDSQINDKHL